MAANVRQLQRLTFYLVGYFQRVVSLLLLSTFCSVTHERRKMHSACRLERCNDCNAGASTASLTNHPGASLSASSDSKKSDNRRLFRIRSEAVRRHRPPSVQHEKIYVAPASQRSVRGGSSGTMWCLVMRFAT